MARITHLTSVHRADDVRIFKKECRTLAAHGWDVSLIAPHAADELRGGVSIHAIRPPQGRLTRMTRTIFDVYRAAVRTDADLFHLHDPELLPIGVQLSRHGKKVIYDVHEDFYKQNLRRPWVPRGMRHVVGQAVSGIEQLSARGFSGIVAATDGIARKFADHKTVVVRNFPIVSEFPQTERTPVQDRQPFAAYAGALSESRGVLNMTCAMALLPASSGAQLQIAGRCPANLQRRLALTPGRQRTRLLGWMENAEVLRLYQQATVGMVTLLPTAAYVESLPVKLFEYMAAGLPVIASDFPMWRPFVRDIGAGLMVDPRDPQEIAAALRWIFEHRDQAHQMGQRGREAVLQHFNWEQESRTLINFYERQLLAA